MVSLTRFGALGGLLFASAALFPSHPAAGQFTQTQPAVGQSDTLPPGFRGRVIYSGTHEGEVTRGASPSRRNPLGLGARTREHAGQFNLELNFSGNVVTGRYSGTGGMVAGTMTGTRSGSRCRLIDDRYGTVTEAECTRNRFSGVGRVERGRDTMTVRLEAAATQFVDAASQGQQRPVRTSAAESSGNPNGGSRCWTLGFAAPRSRQELEALPTIELLRRGEAMARNNDFRCAAFYFAPAAARENVMAMASFAYNAYSADSPTPNPDLETFWCQRAYRGARASRVQHDLDTVNYLCPIETFVSLMSPQEQRANQASVARARRLSDGLRAEAVARGRAIVDAFFGDPSEGQGRSNDEQYARDVADGRAEEQAVNRQLGREPQ